MFSFCSQDDMVIFKTCTLYQLSFDCMILFVIWRVKGAIVWSVSNPITSDCLLIRSNMDIDALQ